MDFLSEDEVLLIQNSFITNIALDTYYQKLCKDYGCEEDQFFTTDKLDYILGQIKSEIEEYSHKSIKLKIFKDIEIEKYEKYELNYLNSSLFAVDDKVLKIKEVLLGQPYLDSTLNADKPFMIHQTMKSKIPFPKTKDEVLYIKYLDDYLSMNRGIFYLELENFSVSQKAFINKEQFIIQKKKNYELFEFLPYFYNEFEKKPFTIKNYMKARKKKKLIEDKKPYTEIFLLEKEIDNLCNKKLIKNYFSDKIKEIDKQLESYIFLIREPCLLYFKKSQIRGKEFYNQIEKILSHLVLYQFQHSDEKQIKQKVLENLNLKLSMKKYFEGKNMDIESELKLLNQKISTKGYEPLSKKEFLLLSGQMAYYLISQSESSNRTFRLAEHYLKSKNIQTIKKHLRNDLDKYKHKIYLTTDRSKFKNALALSIAYNEDGKLTHQEIDVFLIGLISDNIF
jgi:CRISPR-associated protein Csh1